MIICRTETRTSCFGNSFNVYTLTSDNHNKIVEVIYNDHYDNWDAKYLSNSSRFTKPNYPEILKHLTKRGW